MICSIRSSVILLFLLLFSTISFAQDSSGVTCLSRFPFSFRANSVVVSNNYAYVTAGTSGFCIVNISDPAHPYEYGYCYTPGNAKGVAISGNFAYIADSSAGLRIIDITNRSLPHEVGYCETSVPVVKVAVIGNYAFIVTSIIDSSIIYAIDISSPANPSIIGTYHTLGDARDIAISGNYAFIAIRPTGLQVLSISIPASISEIGSYNLTSAYANTIVIDENRAFLTEGTNVYGGIGYLRIIDISDPTSPYQVGCYTEDNEGLGMYPTVSGAVYSVAVSGNNAYISSLCTQYSVQPPFINWSFYYLRTIDISNPDSLQIIQTNTYDSIFNATTYPDYPGVVTGIAISGNHFFYAANMNGLGVDQAGGNCLVNALKDIQLNGNYACVGVFNSLCIFNVTNPNNPLSVGYYSVEGEVRGFRVVGNYAYVTCYFEDSVGPHGFLHIVNLTNISNPVERGHCSISWRIRNLDVAGNYAYLVEDSDGMHVLNISNPDSVFEVGYCETPGNALKVNVRGNYAYVADYLSGLRVIDISNPVNPHEIAFYNTPGQASDVAVSGQYAYVADGTSGLAIFDISNPAAPLVIGRCDTTGNAFAVKVINHYAYIADLSTGLQIINVTNSALPQEIGFYNTPGVSHGIGVMGSTAYIADGTNLGIYDCSQALGVVDRASDAVPQTFSLKQNYPNPFNPTTTIEYTIPKTSKVELKLFDITGREVGTLVNFNQNPGTYRVKLDASKLASGIYFYRLNAGMFSTTKKMSVVK